MGQALLEKHEAYVRAQEGRVELESESVSPQSNTRCNTNTMADTDTYTYTYTYRRNNRAKRREQVVVQGQPSIHPSCPLTN